MDLSKKDNFSVKLVESLRLKGGYKGIQNTQQL